MQINQIFLNHFEVTQAYCDLNINYFSPLTTQGWQNVSIPVTSQQLETAIFEL